LKTIKEIIENLVDKFIFIIQFIYNLKAYFDKLIGLIKSFFSDRINDFDNFEKGEIEISNLLEHFYMVVDLSDFLYT